MLLTVQDVAFKEIMILCTPPVETKSNEPNSGDQHRQFQCEVVWAVFPVKEAPFDEVIITLALNYPQATNKNLFFCTED